jgi:hypothetical protein
VTAAVTLLRSFASVAACLALVAATGCHGSREEAGVRAPPARLPPSGPLAGERWPAGSVRTGDLLHDDGRRLWRVPLHGRPGVLWTHQRARVYEIAAAPGGRSLAYSVTADPPPPGNAPSAFLYLMRPDGRVQTIDTVANYGSIESPIFLRTPSQEHGPVRLYWVRSHDSLVRGTEHLQKAVVVLDRGHRRSVQVTLRNNEAVDGLWGYAGSPMFALTTIRHDNLPTRFEALRLEQSPRLTLWSELGSAANTDDLSGVAWVSPREYVVPVNQLAHRETSFRLFRVGCEYSGSHAVYQGTAVDAGQWNVVWPLLPIDSRHLLVLGADDVERVAAGEAKTARWLLLDLRTGRVEPTEALWSERGWWTVVQAPSSIGFPRSRKDADCASYEWTFP